MASEMDVPMQVDFAQVATSDVIGQRNGRFRRKVRFLLLGMLVCVSVGVAEIARRKRVAEKHILARRIIAAQINNFIYSLDVLRMAARQIDISPGNIQLSACLLGGSTCTATDAKSQVPFGLRSNMERSSPLLIGTGENPAYYNTEGAPGCHESRDFGCPGWTVKAWFWAECIDGRPACPIANKIHVRYQISPGPTLSHLPSSPATYDLVSDPYAYAETVQVKRI